jgi:hypothetical protein
MTVNFGEIAGPPPQLMIGTFPPRQSAELVRSTILSTVRPQYLSYLPTTPSILISITPTILISLNGTSNPSYNLDIQSMGRPQGGPGGGRDYSPRTTSTEDTALRPSESSLSSTTTSPDGGGGGAAIQHPTSTSTSSSSPDNPGDPPKSTSTMTPAPSSPPGNPEKGPGGQGDPGDPGDRGHRGHGPKDPGGSNQGRGEPTGVPSWQQHSSYPSRPLGRHRRGGPLTPPNANEMNSESFVLHSNNSNDANKQFAYVLKFS